MRKILHRCGLAEAGLLLSLVMLFGLQFSGGFSYFTTYTHANGGSTFVTFAPIEIEESVDGFTKTIKVKDLEMRDVPVYIRVKVICPDGYSIELDPECEWTLDHVVDNTIYVFKMDVGSLTQGEISTPLVIHIRDLNGNRPTVIPEDFNVIVIAESAITIDYWADK